MSVDYPCQKCVEFNKNEGVPDDSICQAIFEGRACRIDYPETTNAYVGTAQVRCVARIRQTHGAPDGLTGPSTGYEFPAYTPDTAFTRFIKRIRG